MNNRKTVAFSILILITIMSLIGCNNQYDNSQSKDNQYPMTILDDAGRTITIESQPLRIISFSPAHTETLFALGLRSKIVGVDDYSNFPEAAAHVQKIGDSFNPNYEMINDLNPDCVITVGTSDSPMVVRLSELGITTVVLQASTMEDVLNDFLTIGKITGSSQAAEELVAAMQTEIKSIEATVESITDDNRVKVFYEVSPPGVWGLWTVGPESFIYDIIRIAGGINITDTETGDYFSYSEEMLILRDPEVIITPNKETPVEIASGARPSWNDINAVINNRIVLVDQDIVSRPGPRILIALKDIAFALYPELFPDN